MFILVVDLLTILDFEKKKYFQNEDFNQIHFWNFIFKEFRTFSFAINQAWPLSCVYLATYQCDL